MVGFLKKNGDAPYRGPFHGNSSYPDGLEESIDVTEQAPYLYKSVAPHHLPHKHLRGSI